jgi:hypothetical protein
VREWKGKMRPLPQTPLLRRYNAARRLLWDVGPDDRLLLLSFVVWPPESLLTPEDEAFFEQARRGDEDFMAAVAAALAA